MKHNEIYSHLRANKSAKLLLFHSTHYYCVPVNVGSLLKFIFTVCSADRARLEKFWWKLCNVDQHNAATKITFWKLPFDCRICSRWIFFEPFLNIESGFPPFCLNQPQLWPSSSVGKALDSLPDVTSLNLGSANTYYATIRHMPCWTIRYAGAPPRLLLY